MRDEDLAGRAVLVQADGDVALVAADRELVRDRRALVGQLAARERAAAAGGFASPPRPLVVAGVERLGALAAVAVDRDGLEAELPRLDVGRSMSSTASRRSAC